MNRTHGVQILPVVGLPEMVVNPHGTTVITEDPPNVLPSTCVRTADYELGPNIYVAGRASATCWNPGENTHNEQKPWRQEQPLQRALRGTSWTRLVSDLETGPRMAQGLNTRIRKLGASFLAASGRKPEDLGACQFPSIIRD